MSRFDLSWAKKLNAWLKDPSRRTVVVIVLVLAILAVAALLGLVIWQNTRAPGVVEAEMAENPTQTYESFEEMEAVTGVPMSVPDGVAVTSYQVVMNVMNQIIVEVDGTEYTLRKLRTATEDISGTYQHWDTTQEMNAPAVGPVTVSQLGDQGVITWNDGTYAHSIFALRGFSLDTALGLALP